MNEEQSVPAVDEGDENPDLMVGEEAEPDHDLNLDEFEDEEDEDE